MLRLLMVDGSPIQMHPRYMFFCKQMGYYPYQLVHDFIMISASHEYTNYFLYPIELGSLKTCICFDAASILGKCHCSSLHKD